MSFSKMAVNKPTTTLIIFIIAVALGIYCTATLPLDLLPEMDIPYIIVFVKYGNAGPEEVENSVTRTLESSLSSVTGLKKMKSESSTGSSMIMMEFEYGTNLDASTNDIRDKIDMVRNYLPEDTDTPIIFQMDLSMIPIMGITVTGSRSPEELSGFVEDVIKPRLEQIDGVASANASGDREKCVQIKIPRDRLDAYEITFTQIAQMVGAQNITSSGGSIESGDSNYSISAEGKYKSIDDVRNTVMTYKPNGTNMVTITLRDMGNVYMGYKKATSEAYFNDHPKENGTPNGNACVMIMLQKQSGKNSVATAEKVRKALASIEKQLPSDVKLIESFNTTDDINNTIEQVVESLLQGIALAVIILYIFLRNFKSTFIIALAIPISVLITLCLMYFCGFSINMMTLSGLLLGIGMLVDNSIVILENIFSYVERDAKPEVAAVLGSEEMIGSISSSTLTSVCIFLPMIMFQQKLGMMGKMFFSFAFTIIFSLLCSLVVAMVLVPVLSSKYLRVEKSSKTQSKNPIYRAFDATMARFFNWLDHAYARKVKWVLHHKALTLGVIAALFVLSIFGVIKIGFVFMPTSPSTSVSLALKMPQGTRLDVTKEVMQQMEANVLNDLEGVKFSSLTVGASQMGQSTVSDSNTASLRITFYAEKERQPGWDNDVTAKDKMRKYFNNFPGAEFTFDSSATASSASTTIDTVIKSQSLDDARKMAKSIQALLKDQMKDEANEITIDLDDGLPELKINMDRNRMYELGVTSYAAGSELAAAIDGKTASRYDDNGKQIDIDVSLDDKDKTAFTDLEQLYVANSMGKRIPFASFSRYEESFAPVTIKRESQMRTVKVQLEPKAGLSLGEVQGKIENLVAQNIVADENVLISYEGAMADMAESAGNFGLVILMAAILVFAVMASQFESFRDPFIILFTMPLSFIGVVFIYAISHEMFNIVSIVGMLVLVGTIVNNGIVLVDYTNLLRKRGFELEEACVEAAGNRLRPILMSTLTTVISLIPMAYFGGETGAQTQPIGLTVLGGMTFGSLMTLFVMPSIYFLFNKHQMDKEAKRAAKLEAKQKLEGNVALNKKIEDLPPIVRRMHIQRMLKQNENNAVRISGKKDKALDEELDSLLKSDARAQDAAKELLKDKAQKQIAPGLKGQRFDEGRKTEKKRGRPSKKSTLAISEQEATELDETAEDVANKNVSVSKKKTTKRRLEKNQEIARITQDLADLDEEEQDEGGSFIVSESLDNQKADRAKNTARDGSLSIKKSKNEKKASETDKKTKAGKKDKKKRKLSAVTVSTSDDSEDNDYYNEIVAKKKKGKKGSKKDKKE